MQIPLNQKGNEITKNTSHMSLSSLNPGQRSQDFKRRLQVVMQVSSGKEEQVCKGIECTCYLYVIIVINITVIIIIINIIITTIISTICYLDVTTVRY